MLQSIRHEESVVKNPPSNEGDTGDVGEEDFMPGSGRSPRGENSN